MTVVAAGFDKIAPADEQPVREPAVPSPRGARPFRPPAKSALPSILIEDVDEDVDVFAAGSDESSTGVPFDAEEDLDIPDFLKN